MGPSFSSRQFYWLVGLVAMAVPPRVSRAASICSSESFKLTNGSATISHGGSAFITDTCRCSLTLLSRTPASVLPSYLVVSTTDLYCHLPGCSWRLAVYVDGCLQRHTCCDNIWNPRISKEEYTLTRSPDFANGTEIFMVYEKLNPDSSGSYLTTTVSVYNAYDALSRDLDLHVACGLDQHQLQQTPVSVCNTPVPVRTTERITRPQTTGPYPITPTTSASTSTTSLPSSTTSMSPSTALTPAREANTTNSTAARTTSTASSTTNTQSTSTLSPSPAYTINTTVVDGAWNVTEAAVSNSTLDEEVALVDGVTTVGVEGSGDFTPQYDGVTTEGGIDYTEDGIFTTMTDAGMTSPPETTTVEAAGPEPPLGLIPSTGVPQPPSGQPGPGTDSRPGRWPPVSGPEGDAWTGPPGPGPRPAEPPTPAPDTSRPPLVVGPPGTGAAGGTGHTGVQGPPSGPSGPTGTGVGDRTPWPMLPPTQAPTTASTGASPPPTPHTSSTTTTTTTTSSSSVPSDLLQTSSTTTRTTVTTESGSMSWTSTLSSSSTTSTTPTTSIRYPASTIPTTSSTITPSTHTTTQTSSSASTIASTVTTTTSTPEITESTTTTQTTLTLTTSNKQGAATVPSSSTPLSTAHSTAASSTAETEDAGNLTATAAAASGAPSQTVGLIVGIVVAYVVLMTVVVTLVVLWFLKRRSRKRNAAKKMLKYRGPALAGRRGGHGPKAGGAGGCGDGDSELGEVTSNGSVVYQDIDELPQGFHRFGNFGSSIEQASTIMAASVIASNNNNNHDDPAHEYDVIKADNAPSPIHVTTALTGDLNPRLNHSNHQISINTPTTTTTTPTPKPATSGVIKTVIDLTSESDVSFKTDIPTAAAQKPPGVRPVTTFDPGVGDSSLSLAASASLLRENTVLVNGEAIVIMGPGKLANREFMTTSNGSALGTKLHNYSSKASLQSQSSRPPPEPPRRRRCHPAAGPKLSLSPSCSDSLAGYSLLSGRSLATPQSSLSLAPPARRTLYQADSVHMHPGASSTLRRAASHGSLLRRVREADTGYETLMPFYSDRDRYTSLRVVATAATTTRPRVPPSWTLDRLNSSGGEDDESSESGGSVTNCEAQDGGGGKRDSVLAAIGDKDADGSDEDVGNDYVFVLGDPEEGTQSGWFRRGERKSVVTRKRSNTL